MKKMKKLLVVLLAILMLIGNVVGIGSAEVGDTTDPIASQETTTPDGADVMPTGETSIKEEPVVEEPVVEEPVVEEPVVEEPVVEEPIVEEPIEEEPVVEEPVVEEPIEEEPVVEKPVVEEPVVEEPVVEEPVVEEPVVEEPVEEEPVVEEPVEEEPVVEEPVVEEPVVEEPVVEEPVEEEPVVEEPTVEEPAEEAVPTFTVAASLTNIKEKYAAGEEIGVIAVVEGEYSELSYQWQVKREGSESWEDVSGAQGSEYLFVLNTENANDLYRVIVTCAEVQVISNEVAAGPLEVVEEEKPEMSVKITSSRSDIIIEGEEIVLSSELIGFDGVEYALQWQCNDGSGWKNVEGATDGTYTFTADANTMNMKWRLAVIL